MAMKNRSSNPQIGRRRIVLEDFAERVESFAVFPIQPVWIAEFEILALPGRSR